MALRVIGPFLLAIVGNMPVGGGGLLETPTNLHRVSWQFLGLIIVVLKKIKYPISI